MTAMQFYIKIIRDYPVFNPRRNFRFKHTHIHLLVRCRSAAAAVDGLLTGRWTCQYSQSATGDVTPPWWQRKVARKLAGFLSCGVALTTRCTAVVDRPWSSPVLSYRHRRWLLPGTRNRWRWQGWRYGWPSSLVSWTWASTSRSILYRIQPEQIPRSQYEIKVQFQVLAIAPLTLSQACRNRQLFGIVIL